MSDKPAIIFDGISKMYHKRAGMGTLLSMIPGLRPRQTDEFWALKDISFEVKRGECLGIIGPNGAGKSTILKILSRVTSATSGSYRVDGRLSSLIEVGAGFHPELTGRENVYLNAAILGMSKREIGAKFDDIVDFADLRDFIDVPVKRYSSGMYVRLGFAVAIHTEPDVLLVDEVLAVGDFRFQRKCSESIQGLTARGVSLVLVTHSISNLRRHCERAILLAGGRISEQGKTDDIVRSALARMRDKDGGGQSVGQLIYDDGTVSVANIRLSDNPAADMLDLALFDPLTVTFDLARRQAGGDLMCSVILSDAIGNMVFAANTAQHGKYVKADTDSARITASFGWTALPPGEYDVLLNVCTRGGQYILRRQAGRIRVCSDHETYGPIQMEAHWHLARL